MRIVAILGILVALAAGVIASYALYGVTRLVRDQDALMGANNRGTVELTKRIEKLQLQVDALAADRSHQAAAEPASAAPAASVAAAPAAPVVAADDAHIKEVVDAELQAQFQKMRAQFGGGGPGGMGGGQATLSDAATVKTQLGVDDLKAEQTAKIVADLRAAVRDVWRAGGDRDANMKKMQDLRTDAEAKLAAVLSPEELAKAKTLLDQQGGGRRRNGQGGGPGGGGDNGAPADGQPAPPKGTSF